MSLIRTIEETVTPLLDVLVPVKEIEFLLMPRLMPTTLSVRYDKEGGYVWGTSGIIMSDKSAPSEIYWERITQLYNAIIHPDLLDALDALPEETKSEWWYKVYRLCAEEVYFGEIRHMHPEDLEATLYINVKELTMFFHNATMPTPESLNA
jgi:hypothetical protein